ncbi:MAG: glutamate racemase [Truepera sp.]|nr:glutamate racemase [Truepera sp.]
MPAQNSAPIGVFDSGVGGLTVLRALRQALPNESFVYLGDTARLPYGSKPLEMVRGFAEGVVAELVSRGVKGVVVACNTASAAALPALGDRSPVPLWGVVEPGVSAALRVAGSGRVGVLGTVATVGARVYQDRLEAAGASTWSRACPLFVPIVEEGLADGPGSEIAQLVASHYLRDRPELDAIILGCTHYPALKNVLRRVVGAALPLIDSADEVAAVVARDVATFGLGATGALPGSVHYLVTGDVGTFLHGAQAFGVPVGTSEQLDVTRLTGLRAAASRAGG